MSASSTSAEVSASANSYSSAVKLSWLRSFACTISALVLVAVVPAAVAAQQPDTVVTPEQRALERLRERAPLIATDTGSGDTAVVVPDSLVPPPTQ